MCASSITAKPDLLFLIQRVHAVNRTELGLTRRKQEENNSLMSGSHLVEDVKASFSRVPCDHARFFQQEVGDFPTIWFTAGAELNLEVFALPEETCSVKQCLNTHTSSHTHTPAAHCLMYPKVKENGRLRQSEGVMRFPAALRLLNSINHSSSSYPFLNVAVSHLIYTCHIQIILLLDQTQGNKIGL